jgi:hypothetical protein
MHEYVQYRKLDCVPKSLAPGKKVTTKTHKNGTLEKYSAPLKLTPLESTPQGLPNGHSCESHGVVACKGCGACAVWPCIIRIVQLNVWRSTVGILKEHNWGGCYMCGCEAPCYVSSSLPNPYYIAAVGHTLRRMLTTRKTSFLQWLSLSRASTVPLGRCLESESARLSSNTCKSTSSTLHWPDLHISVC